MFIVKHANIVLHAFFSGTSLYKIPAENKQTSRRINELKTCLDLSPENTNTKGELGNIIYTTVASSSTCSHRSPPSHQAKAFLSANPQLAKKLQETLSDKLAQGKEDITVETGDVPADPPSLAASSENLFEAKGTVSVEAEIVEPGGGSIVSIGGDDTSPSSGGTSFIRPLTKSVGEMGGKGEEGEILLEPGVSSVEELFRSDVLAKGGGKAGQAQQKKNADETHHQ